MMSSNNILLLFGLLSCFYHLVTCDGSERAMNLHASAIIESPNVWLFYQIGGITYDKSTDLWIGVSEGNLGVGNDLPVGDPIIFTFKVDWELYEGEDSPRGSITIVDSSVIKPRDGLKCEGIVAVPCADGVTNSTDYWIVSESNSNTELTASYFSKNFGHPDLNTFVPGSFENSKFVRVGANGEVKEDIDLPEWIISDGAYQWDPLKCYGNRVLKGLHSLTLLEPPEGDLQTPSQLIMAPQLALYQDGAEPTLFEGSHIRIMYWNVLNNGGNCSTDVQYSRSYRYETTPMGIETFEKGARHVRGVFGILAVSSTELLVTETEILEGFGVNQFIADVFYIKFNESDTVDHCPTLMECDDVPVPKKRHLVRTTLPYEMSDLAWGQMVNVSGELLPTVAITYEDDAQVGLLMELYTFNVSNLEFEPFFEDSGKNSDDFVTTRIAAITTGLVVFALGIIIQFFWTRRQKQILRENSAPNLDVEEDLADESTFCGLKYKNYLLTSSIANSCLLGGLVFGFPGLVLILRKDGVYADVCSCGVFCAGQQEKMALLSTIGFASAIGSRLFAGLFLDRFGPKITSFLSGILSITGLLLMATARDIQQLSDIITPAWVVLATGGSAMHLTSFHVTNLQIDKDKKKQASVYISAGFGGGSLILPILQIINQYGDVKLQTIAAWYAGVAAILTINSFFHQPWRAWNAIGSKASVDVNCFRRNWWPNSMKLTSKKLASDKKFMPLKKVLTSFAFWGECFWFSGHVFMLTYYLSTINQILYSLGDARVNDNIDSFLNNVFTRVAVFFNGLGFLWAPSIAFLSRTKSLYFRIYFETGLAIVMTLLLTIPIIEVQIVVFICQALIRLQVFSYHFAYLAERFGFRHFGLLNGISSLVAGLLGLAGYWLQLFSIYVSNGSFATSYYMVAGLLALTLIFPITIQRIDKKEEQVTDKESQEKVAQNGLQQDAEAVGTTPTSKSDPKN